ncbi:uncharacterized protein CXQ87_002362 [Candidozyma duobushaemuli]|uniref:SAC3/GANP/THP3 conserved domain-containing protein n=1 Tax=Candidozyma duobushaemuli TaxID=1231522 RepID=A0A2V1A981_9ASCO|nr:uncharacterized protein CXQ87_002362 [[Candida] duobushaemulonis]PVH14235.1 hypothetical protein CXQ87_002362 [[Candida] duobushaemulonis]
MIKQEPGGVSVKQEAKPVRIKQESSSVPNSRPSSAKETKPKVGPNNKQVKGPKPANSKMAKPPASKAKKKAPNPKPVKKGPLQHGKPTASIPKKNNAPKSGNPKQKENGVSKPIPKPKKGVPKGIKKKPSKSRKRKVVSSPGRNKLPIKQYVSHIKVVKKVKGTSQDLKPNHLAQLAMGQTVRINGKIYYPHEKFKTGDRVTLESNSPIVTGYSSSEDDDDDDEDMGDAESIIDVDANSEYSEDGVEVIEDPSDVENDEEVSNTGSASEADDQKDDAMEDVKIVNDTNEENSSEMVEGDTKVYDFEIETSGVPVKEPVAKPDPLVHEASPSAPNTQSSNPAKTPSEQSEIQSDSKPPQKSVSPAPAVSSKRAIPPHIVDFDISDSDIERPSSPRNASPTPESGLNKRVAGQFDSSQRKRQPTFVGTSQALEKSFLRLTSEPNPANVRPQKVLQKCLPFVLNRYYSENLSYVYINDQLKAIRQDLNIQHRKNQFTIHVYQAHARIAIENNDLGEFNQCLSQLFTLYEMDRAKYETAEFVVYKILYMIITGNNPEINKLRLRFLGSNPSKHYKTFKWIKPALDLSSAIISGTTSTYSDFIRNIMPKQRFMALSTISKAFKKLSLEYLRVQLALDVDGIDINEFLKAHDLISCVNGSDIDIAQAKPRILSILEQGEYRRIDIKGQV